MATPVSGTISINDINNVFGRGANLNAYRGTVWYQPNSLNTGYFSSGTISLSDFYNKQPNDPASSGAVDYTSYVTYGFVVPLFRNSLTVQIWGAGGGGGGYGNLANYSTTGGQSSFAGYYANGGTGGQMAGTDRNGGNEFAAGGTGGSAYGNVSSITGNNGVTTSYGVVGTGAGAPYGGGNVDPGYRQTPAPSGTFPGGGGAGFYYDFGGKFPAAAGGAGSGGYAQSVFYPGQLTVGATINAIVGQGGVSGTSPNSGNYPYGGTGSDGRIYISWN